MIKAPETIVYLIVLIIGIIYSLFHFSKTKLAPSLSDVFAVITSVAAIFFGSELVFNILFNSSLDIGQLKESKLVIMLGGIAVVWVGGTSCFDVFQKTRNKE